MDLCQSVVDASGSRGSAGYYANMRARFVIDTEQWGGVDHWTADITNFPGAQVSYDFTTAYAALKQGDIDAAREGAALLNEAAEATNAPTTAAIPNG